MPAYDRVVGAKPPSAYARAKTAAATAATTPASRRNTLFSPFTLASTTGRYSNGVFGGLNRLLAAGLVAAAVLVAPSAALACNGGTSAVNVYRECIQTGGGGKSTGGGGGGNPSSGPSNGGTTATPISSQTAKAIRHAGKDGKAIAHLVRGYGDARVLQSSHSGTGAAPTAIGSAFDLGSGPTALLVVLAGTAVLLLAGTGVRGFRQRHR
jgi:hypothetical protein